MKAGQSLTLTVLALAAACAVGAQDSAPFGPLTTNNGIPACVQYGSCTDGQSYATTETQNSPVKPPASSIAYVIPTNAAESSASQANLALTGASAAYESRKAAGMGSDGRGNGATVPVDTAQVIAGKAPTAVSSTSGAPGGENMGVRMDVHLGSTFWTVGMAITAMALGGAVVL